MMMGLEPPYIPPLLSDVPGDVALAIGASYAATALAAIVALWRQHLKDAAEKQANTERSAASAHATATAMEHLSEAIKGQPDAAKKVS